MPIGPVRNTSIARKALQLQHQQGEGHEQHHRHARPQWSPEPLLLSSTAPATSIR
jgi:hypothetical protein